MNKHLLTKNQKKTWPLIKRIWCEFMPPYMGKLWVALFFMAIAAIMTASFALLIEPVIDDVLVAGKTSTIFLLAGMIFFVFITRGLSTYFHTIMMNFIAQNIVGDVQKRLFCHFLDLDFKFFVKHPSGELLSRVINDVNVMRGAITDTLTGIGKSLLTLLFLGGVMFHQDWKLALAALTIFPLAAGFVFWIGRRLRKMSGTIQEDTAKLSDMLSQIFQGIRLVKAYGMEIYEKSRASEAIERVRNVMIKSVRVGNLSTPVNESLVGVVVFGIIVYGGYQVGNEQTTAGELMSFITAFIMAYEPMKKLAKLNNTLQLGLGAAERVFEMLDRNSRITEKPDAIEIQIKKPEIKFENVEFQYNAGDEHKALNGVSFNIPAGKVSALVGRSGSGKTTIMNLIPRFFDVTSGKISIGKQDIRDLKIKDLRAHTALVSQDITIFDDTVWGNIRYGREDADQDDIIKAAKAAEAHEFIESLPKGYDTVLGEGGVKLSGGQRQRISIARAILRDAPILLLDEATSALDNEAERAIQETLSKFQKGRTTLIIAHRLTTVQNADKILVLEDGKLVEQGKHDELLEKQGHYARMYGAGLKE